ncbi:MAG TPA: cytochrome c [Bryobacteraceae bacterium]|nr:cytochrome c [Bryobacteraceae bacterium]
MALFLSVSAWAETLSPQLETGRKIFVQRCSSCHAERGDKPLSTGLPLSDRTLTGEQLARAVAGRLKGSPGDEKRAVELYIRSFQKK